MLAPHPVTPRKAMDQGLWERNLRDKWRFGGEMPPTVLARAPAARM
jgi:hypothetical protein